jgi:HK97 family phage portal protein
VGLRTFFQKLGRNRTANAEQRSGYPYSFLDGLISNLGAVSTEGEALVTPLTAMRVSTFYTCVLVRAESLASLPAHVCQYTSGGTIKAYNHPAHYLIHDRPNPFQTASDFWKTVSAHIDTQGEAIAIISFSGNMRPTALNLISEPREVDVIVSDGRPWYRYKGVLYEDWQVLHFKDLSLDGLRGTSKVRYNAETLGYASKLKAFGKSAIGTKPPGYFSTEASFDTIKRQQEDLAKGWKENIAAGKTPFLPLGLKYNHLMISPGDAQYLDAINATKEDIYGICRVPPTLAQNYERATFSNAEQQDLVFIKYTMLPLITNIEQECNSKLFSESNKTSAEPYYVKFNVAAFMRGDLKSRAEFYRTLASAGLINGDTVADLEDWNKWEGGDMRFVPLNMIPLHKAEEYADKLIESLKDVPKPSGGGNSDDEGTAKRFKALEGFIYNYQDRKNEYGK